MAETLRASLMDPSRADDAHRRRLHQLVRHAYCEPRELGLRDKARRLFPGEALFVPPAPGHALLVAATGTGGSLWLLQPNAASDQQGYLARSCRAQLETAQRLVSRELPLISQPLGDIEWGVEPIVARRTNLLEGDSFGLSFCLATASSMLQLGLPADLAASAAIHSDGSLHPVDEGGLADKLVALRDWAPAVRRFLVAASQLELARKIALEMDSAVEFVGVRTLREAIDVAFPRLVERASERWSDPPQRRRVVERLFQQVVHGGSSLIKFEGIARACDILLPNFAADSEERRRLEFTRTVARGHDAAEDALELNADWLSSLRRPLRMDVLSHVVSRSSYASESERAQILRYASRALPESSLDDHAADLRVLGAMGRVLAPLGEYDRALTFLRRAVAGWFELAELQSASHSLCELIRVAGVADDEPLLLEAIERYVRPLLSSGTQSENARAFLLFAVGRAFAQLGQQQECLRWFSEEAARYSVDWQRTALHLQASQLRWEASALSRLVDANAAAGADVRRALEALAAESEYTEFAWVLCNLDRLLDEGAPAAEFEAWLGRFAELEPKAFAMATSLASGDNPSERAFALTKHYPY